MPWSASDAHKKTHAADTSAEKHKWQAIANTVLKKDGDEGKAIRIANAAMHKGKRMSLRDIRR